MQFYADGIDTELHQVWRPTEDQVETAKRIINSDPETSVLVGLALPGKSNGWWTKGQTCEPAEGYFVDNDDSYGIARNAADAAAGRKLGARPGVASYCAIEWDGHWSVFEGITGDPKYSHLRGEW